MLTQPGLAPPTEQDFLEFMIALGEDVIGRWSVSNQRDVHKWIEAAKTANAEVWSTIPSPVALFFMRADLNRRCHRYYWEAQDAWESQWYLQPFLKAVKQGIVETVLIPWGHGVVARVAKSTNGLVIEDMFNDGDVVFKIPDIRQGNRANTMAGWWYRFPDRGNNWCDLIFGIYSPVYAAFTDQDLERLSKTLELRSDTIKKLANRLVTRNAKYVEAEARKSLASSPPDPWRTFAIFVTELEFLQVAACSVLEGGHLHSVEVCSHPFRHDVALKLPRVLKAEGKEEWSVGKELWHPLDPEVPVDLLVRRVGEDLLLLVRGRAERQFLETAAHELDKRLPTFTDIETALQLCCHGLPASTSLDTYPSLVTLACCEEVRSITLVRTPCKSRPLPNLPKYRRSLSRKSNAPKYTPAERQVPQVLLHVEAYCDHTGTAKEWVRELIKDIPMAGFDSESAGDVCRAKSCAFLNRLSNVATGGTFPIVQIDGDNCAVQLLLFSQRNLDRPIVSEAIQQLLKDHLSAIRSHQVHHGEPVVNRALRLYRQCVWDHDQLQDSSRPTFQKALGLSGIEAANTVCAGGETSGPSEPDDEMKDSLKALLMNHDHEGLRTFEALSKVQLEQEPRSMSVKFLRQCCRSLKIDLSTEIEGQNRITLPVLPGFSFLVALRSAMTCLRVGYAELNALSPGAPGGRAEYILRIPCDRSTVGLASSYQQALEKGPETVGGDAAWALVCLKNSKTYGFTNLPRDEHLQYFEGLASDVCTVKIDNQSQSVLVSWNALAPFSARRSSIPEKHTHPPTAEAPQSAASYFLISRAHIDERSLDELAHLLETAAILLNEDRLPGNWGRTIGRYMTVTQPEGMWSETEITNIVRNGSLTHTYHALDGLRAYHNLTYRPFNVDVACNVERYLRNWRLESGAFASPVTNFDGSAGGPDIGEMAPDLFRSQVPQLLRHTAAGILTINRLLDLRDLSRENGLDEDVHVWAQLPLEGYVLKALRVLGAYSAQLEIQMDNPSASGWTTMWGQAKYTPAYIVLAVDEGLERFASRLPGETHSQLEKVRTLLIDYILAHGLEDGERFFCQRANPKAYYYYTVLILEHFLAVQAFVHDSRAAAFCRQLVDALNGVVLGGGGLPYGYSKLSDRPSSDFPDVGVTARYLGVLQSYRQAFAGRDDQAVADIARRACSLVVEGYQDLDIYARNQLTHGWEALLKLPKVFEPRVREMIAGRLGNPNVAVRAREFARVVGNRCFAGRTVRDDRLRLIEYLRNSPVARRMPEAINPDTSQSDLKVIIEGAFSRRSLLEFFEQHKIPFRKDVPFEQMSADLLWQFGFEPVVTPGRRSRRNEPAHEV